MTASQLLRNSEMVDVLTQSRTSFLSTPTLNAKTPEILQYPRRGWVGERRETASDYPRLSMQTNDAVGSSECCSEEEAIYETLSRHSTNKNEHKAARRVLTYPLENTNCCHCFFGNASNEHRNMSCKSIHAPDSEKHADGFNCHRVFPPYNECKNMCDISSPSQSKDRSKILCQLSVYQVDGDQERPRFAQTNYYQAQAMASSRTCAQPENTSPLFHSRSLEIAHDSSKQKSLESGKDVDLILSPLKEHGDNRHRLCDRCQQFEMLDKVANTYDRSSDSNLKCHPTLPVMNLEMLRDPVVTFNIKQQQCKSSEIGSCCSRTGVPRESSKNLTKRSDVSTSPEAVRILAKLGPLPPLPVQCKVSSEKETSKLRTLTCAEAYNEDESRCLKYQRSLLSSSTSNFLLYATNGVSAYPVVSLSFNKTLENNDDFEGTATCSQIFSVRQSNSNYFTTKEIQHMNSHTRPVNCQSAPDFHEGHSEVVCTTRCFHDNTEEELIRDSHNHYFILEAQDQEEDHGYNNFSHSHDLRNC